MSGSSLVILDSNIVIYLLSLFRIIDITQSVANKVIYLKKKRKIKLPDAIIIATTLVEKAILHTNDKQLHGVEELNIRYFEC
jgi:predicted nucleic acid-binding protein